MHPYAGAINDAFLLQDDNARPHRALIVDAYLEQKTIHRMQWPARSQDLSPIQQVSDAVGRRIDTFNTPPRILATFSLIAVCSILLLKKIIPHIKGIFPISN